MNRFLFIAAMLMAAPATAVAQGMTITRPVDPAKPRDGFGMKHEVELRVTGSTITSKTYPRVTMVTPGTPADSAGLQPGDVILSADGRDLVAEVVSLQPPAGTVMVLRVQRGDSVRTVRLTSIRLYTPPDSLNEGRIGQPRPPGAFRNSAYHRRLVSLPQRR